MTDTPLKTAGETMLEACAREVEYSARGVNTWEYDTVIGFAASLRALAAELPLKTCSPADVLSRVKAAVAAFTLPETETGGLLADYFPRLVVLADERVSRVDLEDPIGPFSDNAHWWPYNSLDEDGRSDLFYKRHPRAKRPEPAEPPGPSYLVTDAYITLKDTAR